MLRTDYVNDAYKAVQALVTVKGTRVRVNDTEVYDILNRAAIDKWFWAELMENGTEALRDYNISTEAGAAVVSGDINWIEKNIGKLTDIQMKYLNSALQVERW